MEGEGDQVLGHIAHVLPGDGVAGPLSRLYPESWVQSGIGPQEGKGGLRGGGPHHVSAFFI